MSNLLTIGQRVRQLRGRLSLTQEELAPRMEVSRNYLSMVENGREPGDAFLRKLEILEIEAGILPIPSEQRSVSTPAHTNPEEEHVVIRESEHPAYGFGPGAKGKLSRAMADAHLSAKDLAKRIQYPTGVVQAIFERGSRITESMAQRIVAVLPALSLDELLEGSDSPKILEESGTTGTFGAKPNVVLPPGMCARFVPLLSWTQAGAMSEYTDDAWEGEGVLAVDAPVGRTFALKVRGDSMVPEIREGDIVIVTADRRPRTGEVVIARSNAGDVMCKLYSPRDGGRRVLLTSYNHEVHKPIELAREEIKWIYPVLSVMRNLAAR